MTFTPGEWDRDKLAREYVHLPVTPAHYLAIGHVAAMWAAVETQIQRLIWAVLGLPEADGKLLTAAQRLDTHLTVLNILAHTRDITDAQRAEVATIIAETKRLLELRNTVVHAAWVPGADLLRPEAYRLRAKDAIAPIPFTAPEIEQIALEINALIRRNLLLLLDLPCT